MLVIIPTFGLILKIVWRKILIMNRYRILLMKMLFLIDRKDEDGIIQCAGRMRNNLK